MKKVSLIPFVCSAGGQVPGSEKGALDLKKSGLAEALRKASRLAVGWQIDPAEIYDLPQGEAAHKNLPPLGSRERKDIVVWHCRYLQAQVLKALHEKKLPVTIGGDHAMAVGSISAVAKFKNAYGRTGVIWIDAHADLNTPDTSPSQAIHGMPVAALMGMGDMDYVEIAGDRPVINPRHIVYIGLRDIDPGEQEYIKRFGIPVFTMQDIRRLGIKEVFARAVALLEGTVAKVISVDLDGFDPAEVPSVGSPAAGGLATEETLEALKELSEKVAFDLIEIAEYNPALPGRDKTYSFVEKLLNALLPS